MMVLGCNASNAPFRNPKRRLPSHKRHDMNVMFALRRLLGEDVRVTGIEDGHGGSPEGLTTRVSEVDLSRGMKSKYVVLPSKV